MVAELNAPDVAEGIFGDVGRLSVIDPITIAKAYQKPGSEPTHGEVVLSLFSKRVICNEFFNAFSVPTIHGLIFGETDDGGLRLQQVDPPTELFGNGDAVTFGELFDRMVTQFDALPMAAYHEGPSGAIVVASPPRDRLVSRTDRIFALVTKTAAIAGGGRASKKDGARPPPGPPPPPSAGGGPQLGELLRRHDALEREVRRGFKDAETRDREASAALQRKHGELMAMVRGGPAKPNPVSPRQSRAERAASGASARPSTRSLSPRASKKS